MMTTNYSGDSELGMPPGFRFHPTDEELVLHYLIRKCASQAIAVPIIKDVDLYKFDPWQLPEMALYGEKEWYFFSPRDRKYPNGSRPNRAAGTGYWKATGADKAIGKPKAVGIKKALVFYAGRSPNGVKTNWIMHEYRLANVDRSAGKKTGKDNLRLDDWVLCRIYNKKGKVEKYNVSGQQQQQLSQFPECEDEKPKVASKSTIISEQASPLHIEDMSILDELMRFESKDSGSKLVTNSSGSWHGNSSDITCEKEEVQSKPKENDFGNGLDFQFDYFDSFSNDPFEPQMQYPPGEFYLDMFM